MHNSLVRTFKHASLFNNFLSFMDAKWWKDLMFIVFHKILKAGQEYDTFLIYWNVSINPSHQLCILKSFFFSLLFNNKPDIYCSLSIMVVKKCLLFFVNFLELRWKIRHKSLKDQRDNIVVVVSFYAFLPSFMVWNMVARWFFKIKMIWILE